MTGHGGGSPGMEPHEPVVGFHGIPSAQAPDEWLDFGMPKLLATELALRDERDRLARELAELRALINAPIVDDFLKAVPLEAAHQVERWGAEHDRDKTALDWYWVLGYLLQKAVFAELAGDPDKLRHHVITSAAALLNWHRQAQARLLQTSAEVSQVRPDAAADSQKGGT